MPGWAFIFLVLALTAAGETVLGAGEDIEDAGEGMKEAIEE